MFSRNPAMRFCFPFVSGIIVGWTWQFPGLWFQIGLCLMACLFLAALRMPSILLFILILLFGIFKITFDGKFVAGSDVRKCLGRRVMVIGTVTDEPRRGGASIRFVVQPDTLIAGDISRGADGGLLVVARKSDSVESLQCGDVVTLVGELSGIGMPRNPGEFNLREYLYLNDVYAKLLLDSISPRRPAPGFDPMTSLVYPVRHAIARRIDRYFGGDEGKFLKGLLLGERSEIERDVKSAFISSGVMHILAVSGLHVAIVVFILMALLNVLRIPPKIRTLLICATLVYYNFLTGGAPSVTRSVIMGVTVLAGRLQERRVDIYNSLALSAIIILLRDSRSLFQPGFQLSFAAVFSLVYFYEKLYALRELLPVRIRNNSSIRWTIGALAISLAAGIGTVPLTAEFFGRVSLIGLVANIIIVPLSNAILALGMVCIAMSYLWPWLASVYADGTWLLTTILLKLVRFFGAVPHASVSAHLTLLSSLEFYLIAGGFVNLLYPGARKYALFAILVGCNLWVYGNVTETFRCLRVTFLDVGQGDAIFLEFPDGKTMLVDGGPRTPSFDAGERIILPFLRFKEISRIDYLIVTHPHSDHIGGIPFIIRNLRVGEIADAGSRDPSALSREFSSLVDSLGIPHTKLRAGINYPLSRDLRCYVIHPAPQFLEDNNLNNQSVALKVVYGGTSMLLAGDAEKEAEGSIVHYYRTFLGTNLLKVAHHGSNTSSTEEFLRAAQPEIAVISVGVRNRFHHPSPEILRRLETFNSSFIRTDRSGAVVFESDGRVWRRAEWR